MLGRFLAEEPKNSGGRPTKITGSTLVPVIEGNATLADLGLDKKESADSQLLATISDEQPEEFEREARKKCRDPLVTWKGRLCAVEISKKLSSFAQKLDSAGRQGP